jgi:hypothetical protein
MSSRPLLNQGPELPDDSVRLRREIAGLEKELQEAKDQAALAKKEASEAVNAIRALRKQLEPMYTAFRMVFGEISRVESDKDTAPELQTQPDVWQSRIQKVGPGEGRILQTLLDGGEMTFSQIRSAAKTHGSTHHFMSVLLNRNWVQKTGHGSYALKQ